MMYFIARCIGENYEAFEIRLFASNVFEVLERLAREGYNVYEVVTDEDQSSNTEG